MAGSRSPAVVPDPTRAHLPFPLTDMQKLLMVGASDGMENPVRPHLYLEWDWPGLEVDRYRRALNTVLERHLDALVTVTPGLRLQRIQEFEPVPVETTDLTGLDPAATEQALGRIRGEMADRPLPFDTWPWLELRATRYGTGQVRLHLNFSNFFLDLVSGGTLLHEAERLYHEPGTPPPAAGPTLRDAVLALEEVEQGRLGKRARDYWTKRLDTLPEPPPLARHRADGGLRRRGIELPEPVWSAFKAQAGQRALTPAAALLGVYAEIISTWSGSRHFLLANLMTRRLIRDTAHVFGNFSSVYPLEVDWYAEGSFTDRSRRLQRRLARDLAHTHCGGFEVLEALNRVRGGQGGAVCPFVVAAGLAAGPQQRVGFSRLETPQALIDHQFWELTDGSLCVVWDVMESAFPPDLLDEMCAAYESLLDRLAKDPAAWEERCFIHVGHEVLKRRNGLAEIVDPPEGLLHEVPRDRDGTAVVAADGTLSVAGLRDAARNLAGRLQLAGVVPGDRVAVILPKSTGQVVAVHAALIAGAAYVPMDPAWPRERLRTLLSDARVRAAVTDLDLPETVCLPPVAVPPLTEGPAEVAPVDVAPTDLAYVIYTSGSTGRPKGVALDHLGPLNTIADVNRMFGVTADDVIFGVSALSFDLSVYDLFCGATLVLPDPGDSTPQGWLDLLRRHRVSVWNSAPPLMRLLVDAAETAGVRLPDLRLVLLSGDWIPVALPDRIRRIAPNAEVVSLGGATEASIWSIYHRIGAVDPSWRSIPYGRPLANQPWFILDELGRPAPTWTTGHLYIGGIGLARGYFGDQEKTDAAFVRHPDSGRRIYRTGDLGRYLPNGDIELIGRADLQVKIQGYRIEPGEIEHALVADPRVRDAAVLAHDSATGKRLLAYVTAHTPVDGEELTSVLAGSLPAYMVPSEIVVLDRLPVTGNGKLDRAALLALAPVREPDERTPVAPRTAAEQTLLGIWAKVLGTTGFGMEDDFFALGGNSFAALQVITHVRQTLGVSVALGSLLTERTIAGLAACLGRPSDPLVTLDAAGSRSPIFLVHPAGGGGFAYRELAARLDRPCHAFQVTEPVPASVEEFADRYLAELRRVQPRGPYVIGGWSSGAAIALELTSRLEWMGERVERLVIFDAPAPAPLPLPDEPTLRAWFAEDLPGPGTEAEDLYEVFAQVVRASRSYQGAEVEAPALLFRAQDGRVTEFAAHPAQGADWGWAAFSPDVTVMPVPGTHHTMLAAAGALAKVIDQ